MSNQQIPFNKPFLTGKETEYIEDAVMFGKISGNGDFTKKCHAFFQERYNFSKTLLTTSCTDALEMSAILVDIQPGDEVIMPAYTFVSTANAFILRGANIRFVDSREDHPGMDEDLIEELITPKTKAIVVVHYAGISCDMQKILDIADKHDLYVIEDAAQAIESYYTFPDGTRKPLGSIGHLGCFSFHETKNIIAGEGGMLVVNDEELRSRAEIIWEKGTNRSAFFRGEVDKYGWKDIGSSFLPSELTSAFLFAQLENIEKIQSRRKLIWQRYNGALSERVSELNIQSPFVPAYSTNNAHMFYLVTESYEQRTELLSYLKEKKILAVFHYLSLHKSDFFADKHDGRDLPMSDRYSDRLLRLPLYYDLTDAQQNYIIRSIKRFVEEKISDKYFLQSA
ncbi:dTDP-4-amino-4,6-dideoxygalactose transaminase [Gracilimonas mengyeensis]|uniref:dTDP-4-amino-4,6-dideoxygalactose transaminase n=1 Tax=Gracilimonas mengyeensis TaxID=1302730 RepID=A0A521FJY2_9BACT|nr:dTDP-4-amino-4,6-dideoxygalactose transaminase [Gracilimonas mengyeensis]SMO95910.1 dTDP-4-amino-4,6-dideoxygalactose transaminase [Gracilimonas mengyeensis]